MKFTLNTLGAPNWDLEETAGKAREYGYAGVDLRLLDGEVISLESVRANRDRLRALFPVHELPVAVLATSVRLATADPSIRQKTLDEARAWIDLAAELDVPVIRYFAARTPPELDLERSIQAVGELLAQLADHAAAAGVKIGVETHDEFASSTAVARALALAPGPSVGAIWDLFHTARMGETPAHALDTLGDRVLNVHLKDGRRNSDGWQLRLLGEGEIPVKDALRLLAERGYADFISVEWEKKWHPELAEPEVAFPQHLALLREYQREIAN